MPKVKTHSSAKKRFKVTATGKIMRKRTGMRHNLSQKTTRRKRRLQHDTLVSPAMRGVVKRMLKI
ncbi:MAG: 50S ribosomal protein L35 [Candidatus Thermochlorobacter aerophilum]|jgi:large subunit ribosomal protein L35|uniref:Large ribosomal subunit protein bL35 n=1 Tax=Candidatus Thermochlorobacter aerophilus TaxID=1868324 RepID=A0A395M0C3_9BACT|nr:MAG: 50S ribosomal protein L35 [Candidatus Thermochlorobacter aerophilum]